MSWIYIVAVIIFAIVSNVNKATKNKPQGTPRGGMPTFGGGGGQSSRRNRDLDEDDERQERSGSGFPDPTTIFSREYDASPAFPEPAYSPSPDYMTGEGVSLEQADDGVELRTQRMEAEVRRLQSAFDGIAGSDEKITNKSKSSSARATSQLNEVNNRDALRNGVIWAEILGPPRSRKPHSSRR